MRQIIPFIMVFLCCFLTASLPLQAQAPSGGIEPKDVVPWVFTLAAFIFGVYQYRRRMKDKKQEKIAELEAEKEFNENERQQAAQNNRELYSGMLREQLGIVDCYGSPDIKNEVVNLDDAFVPLSISHHRQEDRLTGKEGKNSMGAALEKAGGLLSPKEVLKYAFQHYRLLLVTGDPGSGKTTLLKYYALRCLENGGATLTQLGFPGEMMPLFFPLREFTGGKDSKEFQTLPRALASWSRHLHIEESQFNNWLHNHPTLVLLDGLDEISDPACRRRACRWINEIHGTFAGALFIVTCRATGFRKVDGMDFGLPHARAEIMDFSTQQQADFLRKWFHSVFLSRPAPPGNPEGQWEEEQTRLAEQRAGEVIDYLNLEDNRMLRRLTGIPMLLQILALIWLERGYRPKTRAQLYRIAINYLLSQRDEARDIDIVLDYEDSRLVLEPASLWMQEKLRKDEVEKKQLQAYFQPLLDTLRSRIDAGRFCRFLIERAGVMADYDENHYIFRHKTFREYLAAAQLVKEALKPGRMEAPVAHFKKDWWAEPLRFFAALSNDEVFDIFINSFFQHRVSENLNPLELKLLLQMLDEAPQKPLTSLVKHLNRDPLGGNRRSYILDCLKTIGTPEALDAIKTAPKEHWSEIEKDKAGDIVAEKESVVTAGDLDKPAGPVTPVDEEAPSFRNTFEFNVEYIKIPGGTFNYSVTEKPETAEDFYLCKTPVTNARYRRFIDYLYGKERVLNGMLPPDRFSSLLLEFAGIAKEDGVIHKEFREYLGKDPSGWKEKLRSQEDENKNFNGADQPVVGVSWYGARSYCFWLSCMEAAFKDKALLKDVRRLTGMYRLPHDMEWEWAAGGNPDGTVRKYPWPAEKGEPNPKLANYDGNVGATTPVGSYPEGATPLGLMDMAGNVWEWMENYRDNKKRAPALCGGSWGNIDGSLRCRARGGGRPHGRGDDVGFRPLRPIKDGG